MIHQRLFGEGPHHEEIHRESGQSMSLSMDLTDRGSKSPPFVKTLNAWAPDADACPVSVLQNSPVAASADPLPVHLDFFSTSPYPHEEPQPEATFESKS
jgi:hypothetical protein